MQILARVRLPELLALAALSLACAQFSACDRLAQGKLSQKRGLAANENESYAWQLADEIAKARRALGHEL